MNIWPHSHTYYTTIYSRRSHENHIQYLYTIFLNVFLCVIVRKSHPHQLAGRASTPYHWLYNGKMIFFKQVNQIYLVWPRHFIMASHNRKYGRWALSRRQPFLLARRMGGGVVCCLFCRRARARAIVWRCLGLDLPKGCHISAFP